MNNKSKPQACTVFGIRGAKVLPFGQLTKQNVNYFSTADAMLMQIKVGFLPHKSYSFQPPRGMKKY